MLDFKQIQDNRDKFNIITIKGNEEQIKHFLKWSVPVFKDSNSILQFLKKNGFDTPYCYYSLCFSGGDLEKQFERKSESPFLLLG